MLTTPRRSPVTGLCDSCAQSYVAHTMALVIYEADAVCHGRIRRDLIKAQSRCREIHPTEEAPS